MRARFRARGWWTLGVRASKYFRRHRPHKVFVAYSSLQFSCNSFRVEKRSWLEGHKKRPGFGQQASGLLSPVLERISGVEAKTEQKGRCMESQERIRQIPSHSSPDRGTSLGTQLGLRARRHRGTGQETGIRRLKDGVHLI